MQSLVTCHRKTDCSAVLIQCYWLLGKCDTFALPFSFSYPLCPLYPAVAFTAIILVFSANCCVVKYQECDFCDWISAEINDTFLRPLEKNS